MSRALLLVIQFRGVPLVPSDASFSEHLKSFQSVITKYKIQILPAESLFRIRSSTKQANSTSTAAVQEHIQYVFLRLAIA